MDPELIKITVGYGINHINTKTYSAPKAVT
jgi:hypothetical protein